MKKICSKFNSPYIQIAIVTLSLLIIAIIPLIIIGFYTHPCADDYTYGYYAHDIWSSTHSLTQTLKWALHQVKETYYSWQGTFSSVFLMSLSPAVWGEKYYFLTPVIMLFMIIVPHFYLLKCVLVNTINVEKALWLIVSSIISFLLIETMFTPNEGLYWYNGAVHYVFMHGCMLMLFGSMLTIQSNKKLKSIIKLLTTCLFAIVCGGSNYATALLGILGVMTISVFNMVKHKKWWYIFPLVVYGISFYYNISAPGNNIRQSNFVKGTPLEAIIGSFIELYGYTKIWMTLQIVWFMLMMIPFFWRIAEQNVFSYRMPFIVTILSVCSVACMFTPGMYAMGSPGAGRTINIVKMWFQLLLFLNEGYWIGFIRKRFSEKIPKFKLDVRLYLFMVFIVIGLSFMINSQRKLFDYSSYAAYVSLRAGEAEKYHQEYMKRLEQLNSDEKIITLESFSVKPRLLYFDDIQTDPYDWRNNTVARWYGKEQVYLIE